MSSPLLQIENLHTYFCDGKGVAKAVNGLSLQLRQGETLSIVGESGCGKSVTAQAIMRLLPKTAYHPHGKILFKGEDLLQLTNLQMSEIRGRRISMVFQEPQTSLNPVFTIGDQVREPLIKHLGLSVNQANQKVMKLLEKMGLRDPEKIMASYPHQFSGGMRQRVVIAMAMACEPDLLICDEPTTALDVTIQAQVLTLIKKLQSETGMAVLLITHDLAIVHQMSSRLMVMYSGQMSEIGSTQEVLRNPLHPYTQKLLRCIPSESTKQLQVIPGRVRPAYDLPAAGCFFADRCDRALDKCKIETPVIDSTDHGVACWNPDKNITPMALSEKIGSTDHAAVMDLNANQKASEPALDIRDLQVYFKTGSHLPWPLGDKVKKWVHAVDQVNLRLEKGKTLALVGESGCGKSTIGHAISMLLNEAKGKVVYSGKNLLELEADQLRPIRKHLQIIFQDPYSSLNPRMTLRDILLEGLKVHFTMSTEELENLMKTTLSEVGLPADSLDRYPHQFSGGQRQRLALARALVLSPEVMILDEATSALDVSLQAQVLNLLADIQKRRGLTYLFITHDMGSVSFLAHYVAVMYLGKIVEFGTKEQVLHDPSHPYTKGLLAAVPSFSRPLQAQVLGDIPSPVDRPTGCFFHPRCPALAKSSDPQLKSDCKNLQPELRESAAKGRVACHLIKG